MIFYELRIYSQPKVKFACSSTTDHYKNIIDHRTNLIEISTFEGTNFIIENDSQVIEMPPDSVSVIFPDVYLKAYQSEPGNLTINSIAMEIENMEFIRHDCKRDKDAAEIIKNKSDIQTMFLPLAYHFDVECLHATAMIKTLINHYIRNNSTGNCLCLAKWYDLLAYINDEFIHSVLNNAKEDNFSSSYYYVHKATKYIAEHYCEGITIKDIAARLNITPNYLSTIFKNDTGKTICDYINLLRIKKIRELIFDGKMTLDKVAASVGLNDVRYMQRLFKKYNGVSMQRCRQIDHEISLYHAKPWDSKTLNEDLYKQLI